MASLTFVPYAPKPSKQPNRSIGKHPFKSILKQSDFLNKQSDFLNKQSDFLNKQSDFLNKNLHINSSNTPVQMPLVSREVLGDDDWWQEAARDSVAIVQDAQASGDDLDRPRVDQAAENVNSDDDKDFPALVRLLSTKDKHILTEKGSSVKSNTIEQDFDDDLFVSYGSRAGSSHDEPIVLDSGDSSENGNGNLGLDIGHARRILDSEQPANDAFNLESPLTLSSRMANECENGGNSIEDNNKSPRGAKRQRSASPPYHSIPGYTSKSPLSHNDDGEGSWETVDHSVPDGSGDGDISPKRRKVSAPLGGEIASNPPNEQSQRSPSPISEDEDDGTLSSSANSSAASTARTSPTSESAPLTEPEPCPQVIDANQDWEVRKIIGKEDIHGVLHYLVVWSETLVPKQSLGHTKELVDEFEARLLAQGGVKNGKGRPGLKRGERAVVAADVSGGQQQKRPRGRPRKQT